MDELAKYVMGELLARGVDTVSRSLSAQVGGGPPGAVISALLRDRLGSRVLAEFLARPELKDELARRLVADGKKHVDELLAA